MSYAPMRGNLTPVVISLVATRKRPLPGRRTPRDHTPFGRAGDLRGDRRSPSQDDLPGPLRYGEARYPDCPRSWRRPPEMEYGAPAPTGGRQHKAIGRDR